MVKLLLVVLVTYRNHELAELLLAGGAGVNISHNGQTPLEKALSLAHARRGHICPRNMVKLLVSHNANVIKPAEILMRLGPCRVHEGSSECRIDMGQTFLDQLEIHERHRNLSHRLVTWMNHMVDTDSRYSGPIPILPGRVDEEME